MKLLYQAEQLNNKITQLSVFNVLCEGYDFEPQVLHESMHLLLTRAIQLLTRLNDHDYQAVSEINKLPMYAIATTAVAAENITEFNQFRKDVGDKRPLADFIADKEIVQSPTNPEGGSPNSTNAILANFANVYAKSAVERLKDAFEKSKKDPLVRAKLIQSLKRSQHTIDIIYSKAVGDRNNQSTSPRTPNQRTV